MTLKLINKMSFDDYANHIYQKHRLAIALAIIKTKPAYLSTTQYLDEIKSKINDKMADDDVTVCSDDFIIDDDDDLNDSVTILKDVDPEMFIGDENGRIGSFGDENNDIRDKPTNVHEDLSQITYYNSKSQNLGTIISTNYNLPNHDNRDISTYHSTEPFLPTKNNNEEINSKLKDPHNNSASLKPTNKKQNTIIDDFKENPQINNNSDITFYDSQQTMPYAVHDYTQNTHYSESQANIIVPAKYLYGSKTETDEITRVRVDIIGRHTAKSVQDKNNIIIDKLAKNNDNFTTIDDIQDINIVVNDKKVTENGNINIVKEIQDRNIGLNEMTGNEIQNSYDAVRHQQQIAKESECINTMNMFSEMNDDNFDRIVHGPNEIEREANTIRNNYTMTLMNLEKDPFKDKSKDLTENLFFSQNFTESHDYFGTQNNHGDFSQNLESLDMEIAKEYNQNFEKSSQNINNADKIHESVEKSNVIEENNTPMDLDDNNLNTNNDFNNESSVIANINANSVQNNANTVDINMEEDENDIEEVISYKILEEFNKVKTFLRRRERRMSCDGYSTDSGYRSDSQRSSNRSALQLSGNWLDQSGCCLFNYIMQCHLVAATRDITQEIAQVLSELIDRLHEEEKYPVFLEELLDTVDVLLRQVFEGVSSDDSELLKQDERIQRLLLLNKSIHIQKHTIEKITNILESFHTKIIEKESTYELENIIQIENASYIFHLLEIILKKHLKSKEISTQYSTQISQDEEKVLKRSSITDIWRKKWNLSQKTFEGSKEKKCVLKLCSEVLNKIVVDCVANYSLVAFSALKCFNTMQS